MGVIIQQRPRHCKGKTEYGADVSYELRFYMPANGDHVHVGGYSYNVIDNVSFSLDTLVVADDGSFAYDASLEPNAITLGANATLTIAATDGAFRPEGSGFYGPTMQICGDGP